MNPALLHEVLSLWTPASMGQTLAWWDAGTGVTEASTLVSAWTDRIAATAVAQASGSLKPIYSPTSLNGSAGLTFDGSDDVLALTGAPTAWPTDGTPGWIFWVGNNAQTGTDNTSRSAGAYGGSNADRRVGSLAAGGNYNTRVVVGDGAAVSAATGTNGNTTTLTVAFTQIIDNGYSGRWNGADAGITTSVVPATATTRVRIGASANTTAGAFFQGVLGHFVVGYGTLSQGQVMRLEGWGAWAMNAPQILPASHIYRYRRP